jgi:hypothetical protein
LGLNEISQLEQARQLDLLVNFSQLIQQFAEAQLRNALGVLLKGVVRGNEVKFSLQSRAEFKGVELLLENVVKISKLGQDSLIDVLSQL